MSKKQKLRDELFATPEPKSFKWTDLVTLMAQYGYSLKAGGGSRRKFIHDETGHMVSLHQPHPGNELKPYMVKAAKSAISGIE
jgi:predicted RNA binding protein YcfA (HicA-like mRNA interferase family)